MTLCKQCKKQDIVRSTGPVDADILIMGSVPGDEEMEMLIPFVGPAGKALRDELFLNDIDLDDCRQTYFYPHLKDTKNCPPDFWRTVALHEMTQHPCTLIIGAMANTYLVGRKVAEISSLVLSPRKYGLPLNLELAMAVVGPGDAVAGSVGELRLGLERFAKKLRRIGYAGSRS